jgi:hypothetical protein
MNIEFWQAMVRSGATAYAARATFGDTFGDSDLAGLYPLCSIAK